MLTSLLRTIGPVQPAEQRTFTWEAPRACNVHKLAVRPEIAAHFDLLVLSVGNAAIVDARGAGGGAAPLAHYHDVGLGVFVPGGVAMQIVVQNATDSPQMFEAELLGEWISDGIPKAVPTDADRG